jgi:hypothetical protein
MSGVNQFSCEYGPLPAFNCFQFSFDVRFNCDINKNKSCAACTHAGAQSVTFVVKNNCPYTVWPGTLTAAGRPTISSTGFTLATGASPSLSVPATWSGACGQEHNALQIPQESLFVLLLTVPLVS